MKLIFSILIALLSIAMIGCPQSNTVIKFKFKNSSILPKKLILISYAPEDVGNGTQAFWMWPGGTKEFSFKEGTKLYLANQKQVDKVMGGNRIDTEKPFLIVTEESLGKIYKF